MEYVQIKTNLNVSEMENVYDRVTIETVSHRMLQKSCVQSTNMQYISHK